ncbi:fatty acyl-AMP ligase [Cypionkella sp.]|uniref:fatty acyl-AMP ligase n=1 Tax=Cypionkella sp. TaxID=2811411 RepID=UPI002721ADB9|nr:fatty acyl-AMP ligase [Cypionkella sp.]MDO8986461.1 fatty acyl-AMP ligase [Cypionkella sp.]MDP1575379.1 fatty acyl-AMP ligase [Cypionkella sp.]MDP2048440.1 fatty acyl-AMP ligase [Cypionkella sp.]
MTGAMDMRMALGFWAERKPEALALGFMARGEATTESLNFEAVAQRAVAMASHLTSLMRRREPALLVYPPGLEFIEALFGCFLAGIVAVPVPHPANRRARERVAIIRAAAGAKTILTTGRLAADADLCAIVGPDCDWIATDALADLPTDGEAKLPASTCWSDNDVAIVQFTSGSTSDPRGVQVTFGNLTANHAMMAPVFGDDPDEAMVTWLPMFHDMGLIGTLLYTFQAGRSTHIMPPFAFLQKPVRWLRAIDRLGATISGGPSFAYDLCARSVTAEESLGLNLSRWRRAFCGAEPIRRAALARFANRFEGCGFPETAFQSCYGLAEATLFVSGSPLGRGLRSERPNAPASAGPVVSCGPMPAGQRLRIVDAFGSALPEGERGEIWVAGPHVSQGYWRNPAATALTFCATLEDEDAGGYLRTGDLGFLHGGELFVTGRIKDVVILRGSKHHGNDLDETICAVSPDLVPGAGVVFLTEDGPEDAEGDLVAVLEVSRQAFAAVDRAALSQAVTEAVLQTHGIRLDQVILVRNGSLPRTTSGKIQRPMCRDLFLRKELILG